jgi:hypothetical protein
MGVGAQPANYALSIATGLRIPGARMKAGLYFYRVRADRFPRLL